MENDYKNELRVICASLSKHVNCSNDANDNDLLQIHRKKLVRSAIRHISSIIGQINKLANMLATTYFIQKVTNKQPIPSFVATAEFWGSCQQFVSTLNGKSKQMSDILTCSIKQAKPVKPPKIATDEMIRAKIQQIQNKLQNNVNDNQKINSNKKRKRSITPISSSSSSKQLSAADQRTLNELNEKLKIPYEQRLNEATAQKQREKQAKLDVRPTVEKELYDALQIMKQELTIGNDTFEFPSRDHLSAFLDSEKKKQVTLINNHYMTNFSHRQIKTVRAQVQFIIDKHMQLGSLPSSTTTEQINKIKAAAIKWCIGSINRNKNVTDVQLEDDEIDQDNNNDASFNYKQIFAQLPETIKNDLNTIILEHQAVLPLSEKQIYEKNVGEQFYLYMPYFYYLWQTVNSINGKSFKSFAIIPQLNFKCPFIDIRPKSVNDLKGFCKTEKWKQFYHLEIIEKKTNETTRKNLTKGIELYGTNLGWIKPLSKFENESEEIFLKQLIQHPKDTPSVQFENNCLSDGQQIRFRYTKIKNSNNDTDSSQNKRQKSVRTLVMNRLKPGIYDAQDKTLKFRYLNQQTDINQPKIISIDPGRVDLITAVCHNVNTKIDQNDMSVDYKKRKLSKRKKKKLAKQALKRESKQTVDKTSNKQYDHQMADLVEKIDQNQMLAVDDGDKKISKGRKRRLAKQARQKESKQTVYQLSNKQYYQMAGFVEARIQRQKWRMCSGLDKLDMQLSREKYSSRTFDLNTYLGYVRTVCAAEWWSKQWAYVNQPCHSKLSFASYQQKQRALITIARQLVAKTGQTMSFKNSFLPQVILLWGNGSFQASGAGHASAPNKGLYTELSKYFPVIITDENYSSQATACCVKYVKHACWKKNPKYIEKKNEKRKSAGLPEVDLTNPARPIRSLFYCKPSSSAHTTSKINSDISCCCSHKSGSSRPWNRDVSSALNIYRIFKMNHPQA